MSDYTQHPESELRKMFDQARSAELQAIQRKHDITDELQRRALLAIEVGEWAPAPRYGTQHRFKSTHPSPSRFRALCGQTPEIATDASETMRAYAHRCPRCEAKP